MWHFLREERDIKQVILHEAYHDEHVNMFHPFAPGEFHILPL
jgi:hypothetical protein